MLARRLRMNRMKQEIRAELEDLGYDHGSINMTMRELTEAKFAEVVATLPPNVQAAYAKVGEDDRPFLDGFRQMLKEFFASEEWAQIKKALFQAALSLILGFL